MFSSAKADIVTDASGDATVYIEHGINKNLNGFLVELKYAPGTIATGADLTITVEGTGRPIMTKANAGTSTVWFMPRALINAVADGAENAAGTEFIPIKNDRIKVVIAQGGNAGAGSIEATLMVHAPY